MNHAFSVPYYYFVKIMKIIKKCIFIFLIFLIKEIQPRRGYKTVEFKEFSKKARLTTVGTNHNDILDKPNGKREYSNVLHCFVTFHSV